MQRAQCRNLAPAESDRILFPQGREGRGWTADVDDYCAICPVFDSCLAQEFTNVLLADTRHYVNGIAGIRASMSAQGRKRRLNTALRRWEHRNQLKV